MFTNYLRFEVVSRAFKNWRAVYIEHEYDVNTIRGDTRLKFFSDIHLNRANKCGLSTSMLL